MNTDGIYEVGGKLGKNGKEHLVVVEWHLEKWRCCWLVGLMWRDVEIEPIKVIHQH